MEFKPFTQYLTNLGTTHTLIFPNTHRQNGIAKRKHRHIVDLSLTLLSQIFLPLTKFNPTRPLKIKSIQSIY